MGPGQGISKGALLVATRGNVDDFSELSQERGPSLPVLCHQPVRQLKKLMESMGLVIVDPDEVDRDGNKKVFGAPLCKAIYEQLHHIDKDLRSMATLPAQQHKQLAGHGRLVAEIRDITDTVAKKMPGVQIARGKKNDLQTLLETARRLAESIASFGTAPQP